MGFYLNPTNGMTKERFLAAHGKLVSVPSYDPTGDALVCLVDNGAFKAAGVAFSASELAAFNSPTDTRHRVWYSVPKATLLPHVQPPMRESDFR